MAGERGAIYGAWPTLCALPCPLCRYESIILLADDACLLTELSNVVAYACRHSRTEDRQHVPHSGLLCTPPRPVTSVLATKVSPWLPATLIGVSLAETAETPTRDGLSLRRRAAMVLGSQPNVQLAI